MEEFPSIRILQYTSEHITPDMWGREHVALITPPTPLAALTAPVVIVNTGLASHDLAAPQRNFRRLFSNGRLFDVCRSRGLQWWLLLQSQSLVYQN